MKAKLLFGILAMLVCLTSVFAITMPHPIGGKVMLQDMSSQGVTVTIVNQNTGEKIEVQTNSDGFYMFDAGNFKLRPYPACEGHTLTITACTGDDRCTKQIIINDAGGQTDIDFKLVGNEIIKWNGVTVGVASIVAILAIVGLTKVFRRKGFSEDSCREILQSAANVAIGKLKQMALEKEDVEYALTYEKEHKKRKRVIKYLESKS